MTNTTATAAYRAEFAVLTDARFTEVTELAALHVATRVSSHVGVQTPQLATVAERSHYLNTYAEALRTAILEGRR